MTTHADRAFTRAGNYVRDARKSASLTQAELSERSGVATRTISQLESGRATNVKTSTISKLSRALQLDEDVLIRAFTADVAGTGSAARRVTVGANDVTLPSEALAAVFGAASKLTDEQKLELEELVGAVGYLFTAYALALVADAGTGSQLTVPNHLVSLIRMQTRIFPDASEDRVYLDWLTGLGPELTADQLEEFEARWRGLPG